MIHIRFASAEDCEILAKAISTVIQNIPYYNDLAKENEITKFHANHLVEKIKTDKFSVIIATVENEIAGFCLSRFDDYTIWLEWFGVLGKYRGLGLSKMLLQHLDDTIKSRQSHKIWCDCRTSNNASIHILSKNGYKQIATLYNHWYNQDFILWEKMII